MSRKMMIAFSFSALLYAGVVGVTGCGQSGSTVTQQLNNVVTAISQSLTIVEYDSITMEAADSLTLGQVPSSLKLKVESNCLSASVEAYISINYTAFSEIGLGENGFLTVNGSSFATGLNPISVKIKYPDGQTKISCATLEVDSSYGNLYWGLNGISPYYDETTNKNPCTVSGSYNYFTSSGKSLYRLSSFKINGEEYVGASSLTTVETFDGSYLRKISFECTANISREGTQVVSIETVDIYYRKASASWCFYCDWSPPIITFTETNSYEGKLYFEYGTSDNLSIFLHNLRFLVKDLSSNVIADLGTIEAQAVGNQFISWDYKDLSGLLVPNGLYIFTISCSDTAGNAATIDATFEVVR